MQRARLTVGVLTVGGIAVGTLLAYWRPAFLLAYWLLLGITLGLVVTFLTQPGGVQRGLKWLVTIFALLIGMSLITTQVAARRAISSTHLVYRGVHLVGVDSFTVGAASAGADVRLQTVSSAQTPWLLRLRRVGAGWQVEPLSGIAQVRVRDRSTQPIKHEYSVASSAVLSLPDDGVQIISPWGEVLDTLRLIEGGVESSSGSVWAFEPRNPALSDRFERQLAHGTTLTDLAGTRFISSTVYERYVRIEEVSSGDEINGVQRSLWDRVPPKHPRYLVSATPPFRIGGAEVRQQTLTVRDSAFVEVRNGDGTWRFALLTEWRRRPGAERGMTVLFARNPRPMDTPLPVGVSCQEEGAACGAISLRRLPPPVAHVALDNAGFDPDRFGLLGILRLSDGGYDVVLPRTKYRVEAGKSHMVAVPVTDLEQEHAGGTLTEPDRSSHWILLSATGQRDTIVNVLLIATALALLLFAVYFAVQTFPFGDSGGLTVAEERAIPAGLTALLGLVLTRVTVGARVAFFDPFLDRGIATAVGLCVAIAVVIFGLLTWAAWVPPFFATARTLLSGHSSPRQVVRSALRWASSLGSIARSPRWLKAVVCGALSLILLTVSTGSAAWMGLLTGSIILLAWVLVAWIFAFTGNHFDTFERGAHSVIEQLSPGRTLAMSRSKSKSIFGRIRRIFVRVPELNAPLAFMILVLSQAVPGLGLAVCTLYLVIAGALVVRRQRGRSHGGQPDYMAAGVGVAVFGVIIALLRRSSANGSLGAFVLVVFVALASVRVGRAVGARLEARGRDRGSVTRSEWFIESLLLATPLFLLVVLAPIDMGLFLVLVIPIGCATLLATGTRAAGTRLVVPVAALAVLLIMVKMVVFPSMQPIREARSHAAQAEAFARMSTLFGLRVPGLLTPLDRAAARSVATDSPELAEALVVAARPGTARDLLIPSIEQIWGAKAYARAGMWGKGLGQAVVGGRGVAEAVSYAENTFSVFVLAEHGAIGGMLVLALYLMLTGAVAALIFCRNVSTPSDRASRALFLVVALIVVIPACYVALSNLGFVPITGQNMPFLGLNSWSDVAICAGVFGILITGTLRLLEVKR